MFVCILQDVVFSNRNIMIVILFDSSFLSTSKAQFSTVLQKFGMKSIDSDSLPHFHGCYRLCIPSLQEESPVQALIDACIEEDGKLYLCVSSPTIKDKPVSKCYSNLKLQMKVFQKLF